MMMTLRRLAKLVQELRDKTVLSIYVHGAEDDPAQRREWRIALRHSLDDIETWLEESSHAERESFARCQQLAEEQLARFEGTVQAPGWAGFLTPERVIYADLLPVPVPTMAVWSTGPCIVPYVRAIKESHPVLVAVMDHRTARLYRYVGRNVELLSTMQAPPIEEVPRHLGEPPRAGFHGGTRGSIGADEAQRVRRGSTSRLLADVTDKLTQMGPESWIIVGGIPTVAAALFEQFSPELRQRAMRADHLDVHSTPAQVAALARESASTLRDADDLRRVTRAIESSQSDGRGVVGTVDTNRALAAGQVRELYVTLDYLKNHASDAESAVRLALEHDGEVEHVSGPAAKSLESVGGIAAQLRYAQPALGAEMSKSLRESTG